MGGSVCPQPLEFVLRAQDHTGKAQEQKQELINKSKLIKYKVKACLKMCQEFFHNLFFLLLSTIFHCALGSFGVSKD